MDIQALATEAAKLWRSHKETKTFKQAVAEVLAPYELSKESFALHRKQILRAAAQRSGRKSRGTKRPRRQLSFNFKTGRKPREATDGATAKKKPIDSPAQNPADAARQGP